MLLTPEISDTSCVNLNDALVWIAFKIFPSNHFEPFDKDTEEWIDLIDLDKWIFNNNMYNKAVYTPEICKKYNLPENVVLFYMKNYKEMPYSPNVIRCILEHDDIDEKERNKFKKELPRAIEYQNKVTAFDKALNLFFRDAQAKLYAAIASGEIRIYGIKFTTKNNVYYPEKHISQIPKEDLLLDLFDFNNLQLKIKNTNICYGFLMINLRDLLTKFEPNDITSAKALNVGGKYLLSQDDRFAYSGRNATLTPQQLVLLGCYVSELRTNNPKQQNKYYIYSSITWVEQKFHKQISESTMRSYLKLCLKK